MRTPCKYRYAMRVRGKGASESKRITYCCKLRHGFRIKEWKCIYRKSAECPINIEGKELLNDG